MSTQQGLFPKITNLRIENQSVPNSAHSHAGAQASTMNALKHSGGHISGMSNHHVHNLNNLNERHNYRGQTGVGGVTSSALNPQAAVGQNF